MRKYYYDTVLRYEMSGYFNTWHLVDMDDDRYHEIYVGTEENAKHYFECKYKIKLVESWESKQWNFDRVCNSIIYYNCNSELGRYLKYFLPKNVAIKYGYRLWLDSTIKNILVVQL